MGRLYAVAVAGTGVSAAVDVFEVLAAASKPFTLVDVSFGQVSDVGDAASENLGVLIKRAAGSYTSGSGGGTATPAKARSGDAAAGPTAETCNTTQASAGTGTLTTLFAGAADIQAGWSLPERLRGKFRFEAAEACVVSVTAPADSITVYATLTFLEEG